MTEATRSQGFIRIFIVESVLSRVLGEEVVKLVRSILFISP